jgi:hypothetical protein
LPPVVHIEVVGFGFPVLVASLVALGVAASRRFRITRESLLGYLGLTMVICILSVALVELSPTGDRLNIPRTWSAALTIVSAAAYGILFFRKRSIVIGCVECYPIGVYSMALSDVIRSYVVPVNLPVVYWGANGFGDLVFQFGLYMAMLYYVGTLLPSVLYSISLRNTYSAEKLVGREALQWLTRKTGRHQRAQP